MTETFYLCSSRRFLATPDAPAPDGYWGEVFSQLHARARRSLESWSGARDWTQVASVTAVPRGADGAVLTHATHRLDLESAVAACRALQDRGVRQVFLVLDHQPRALRSLAGKAAGTAEIDGTELLRRLHLGTELKLRKRETFRTRLCRTEVFHLAHASTLDVSGRTAKDFHGCRELYQVLGTRPT